MKFLFLFSVLEAFSFYEIFDLFLVLWNHHPGYDLDSANLGVVKKDMVEIMDTLSKCSLGSLSKMSLGSLTDSEETNDNETEEIKSSVKFSSRNEKRLFDASSPVLFLSGGQNVDKCIVEPNLIMKEYRTECHGKKNSNSSEYNSIVEMPTSDSSDTQQNTKTKEEKPSNKVLVSSLKETVKSHHSP